MITNQAVENSRHACMVMRLIYNNADIVYSIRLILYNLRDISDFCLGPLCSEGFFLCSVGYSKILRSREQASAY